MFGTCKNALDIGVVATNMFWTKLFAFGDMNIIGDFVKSMDLKQDEYKKVLNEQVFLRYDKRRWDAWSKFLATKTGKPILEYPFIERMKGTQEELGPNDELAQ